MDSIFTNKRILIAEDNELNKFILVNYVTCWGGIPHLVTNGKDAIESFKANKYDLVLMDIEMPVMGGIEATKQMRQIKNQNTNIPIVALSANDSDEIEKIIKEAGMNDIIPKPFRKDSLKISIEKILKKLL